MKITLNNTGKRYNTEWIFKNVNYEFNSQNKYAILGSNGSGKSTLLQVIAGNIIQSAGEIKYSIVDKVISTENIFKSISFAAPYIELIEEFTLSEAIDFHQKFKPFYPNLNKEKIIELTSLEKSKDKAIKYYSSGMKQRVKLALSILSDTPLLLLDEPCTNLDKQGIDWFQNLISKHTEKRLLIVCSNRQKDEYSFCNEELEPDRWK